MQPSSQRLTGFLIMMLMAVLALSACTPTFNQRLEDLSAAATQVGEGIEGLNVTLPVIEGVVPPEATSTAQGSLFDIRSNPNEGLATAWGQVNGLASGQVFTILATQAQAGDYVIQTLRLNGWQDTVQGGSVSVGAGQVRVDLAILVTSGGNTEAGAGTATFQPTLDSAGRLRPNPQGATFGSLNVPNNLIGSIQDAVFSLLAGGPNDGLVRVNLTVVELLNGEIRISGTRR